MTEIGGAAVALRAEPSKGIYEKLRPGPGRPTAEVAEHQRARIQGAMLDVSVERGYREVTVRELAQRASVSSRAFYQRFSGKEECFLSTHESIVRCIARRIVAAQAGEEDWRKRLWLTVQAFLDELQQDPRAARFLLVEAYAAGSDALEQVRAAERTFETRIAECFELETGGLTLPPLLARGIVSGLMCVARFRLAEEQAPDLTGLTDELTSWAVSIFVSLARNTDQLQPGPARDPGSLNAPPALALNRTYTETPNADDLIVAAFTKLAAVEGYEEITVRKVRISAGASSRKFKANFTGIEDCFQSVIDRYVCNLNDHAGSDAVTLLCESAASDPAFATVCFVDIFSPGGEIGVHSLRRFVDTLAGLLSPNNRNESEPQVELEARAGAIWGCIREEILAGRQAQLALAPSSLLGLLAADREKMENSAHKNLTAQLPHAMLS